MEQTRQLFRESLDGPRSGAASVSQGTSLLFQTIPWDKVDISVLGIETNHLGEVFPGKLEDLRKFLTSKGYKIYQKVKIDEIYVKRSLLKSKSQ